ncbi:MAG: 50S ribosomal protein L29 [Patescibacteria group bacterium]|jgi:ribosomal protein L29
MEINELRKKTEPELNALLKAQREQTRDLRFRIASKQYKDVRDLRTIKREVAQILTLLKEKKVVQELKSKSIKK